MSPVRKPSRTDEAPLLRRDARGFTLLELMATIAVLAVVLSLGVPAFTDTIRNNQISAAGADLTAALSLARNEAMKRGLRVSVCPAATQDTCSAAKDWSVGWIVFVDDFGGAGTMDEGDVPLQNWPAPAGGVAITASRENGITFTRRARAEFSQSFTVNKKGCSGTQQRLIEVNVGGGIGLTREECKSG